MNEMLIERDELVALLFDVSDIAVTLTRINDFCEMAMKRKKPTKAELEEMNARHARVLANAERTRKLAERAQAKLDARRSSE